MDDYDNANKVAIITGGSSGIGEGIAIEFAKQGYSVALVGRNEKNLSAVAEKCMKFSSNSEKVFCIKADLLNDDDIKLIVVKTINKFGRIDVLVNNAGIAKLGGLSDIIMKDYDEIMQVNVKSIVFLSQEALPHLIKSKGNIINISSVAANMAWSTTIAYSMSKAAVDHFTRCCAIDLAPKGIRINSVLPGFIDTPIYYNLGLSEEAAENIKQVNRDTHPLGRLGNVEEVARTVVFLASKNSSFTTGQTITIDGGSHGGIPSQ